VAGKAVGTAKYAKYAKAERVGENDGFTVQCEHAVRFNSFPFRVFGVFRGLVFRIQDARTHRNLKLKGRINRAIVVREFAAS
jgi:hypothetical protein